MNTWPQPLLTARLGRVRNPSPASHCRCTTKAPQTCSKMTSFVFQVIPALRLQPAPVLRKRWVSPTWDPMEVLGSKANLRRFIRLGAWRKKMMRPWGGLEAQGLKENRIVKIVVRICFTVDCFNLFNVDWLVTGFPINQIGGSWSFTSPAWHLDGFWSAKSWWMWNNSVEKNHPPPPLPKKNTIPSIHRLFRRPHPPSILHLFPLTGV